MRAPSSRPLVLLISAAFALGATSGLQAQGDAVKGTLKAKIDKAIKDYQAIRSDAKKLTQRRKLLGWLGEIDHPRVTKYLQTELKRLARSTSGTYVIEAMGKVERPELEADLLKVVKRPDANASVRIAATRAVVGYGDAATETLLELAYESKNANARRGVIQGLSRCDSVEVRRQLSELILDGEHEHRRYMLLNTATIKGDPRIDRAREQCVK